MRRTASYSRKIQLRPYEPDEVFASVGWDEYDGASPEEKRKHYDEKLEECRQDVLRQIAKTREAEHPSQEPTGEEPKKTPDPTPAAKADDSAPKPKASPPQVDLIEMLVKRVSANQANVSSFLKNAGKSMLSELNVEEASLLIESLIKPTGWKDKQEAK